MRSEALNAQADSTTLTSAAKKKMSLYIVTLFSAWKRPEEYHFTDLSSAQDFMQRCKEQQYKVELSERTLED